MVAAGGLAPCGCDHIAQMVLGKRAAACSVGNRDDVCCRRFGSPWVCINKCIHAAEMVLGKRAAATSQGFAAKLVALAEPAEEQEVQKYYSDPGSLTERYTIDRADAVWQACKRVCAC